MDEQHKEYRAKQGPRYGEENSPGCEHGREADIHGIAGEAVDPAGDHARGLVNLNGVDGGLGEAERDDAAETENLSHQI